MRDDFPTEITHQHTLEHIADGTFELIEDQTIDIDNIAGMVIRHYQTPVEKETYIQSKINELVQAVKYLNKEIQSIKEK